MPKYSDANDGICRVQRRLVWLKPRRKNWLWGLMKSKNGGGCRGHHQGIKKQVKEAFVQ